MVLPSAWVAERRRSGGTGLPRVLPPRATRQLQRGDGGGGPAGGGRRGRGRCWIGAPPPHRTLGVLLPRRRGVLLRIHAAVPPAIPPRAPRCPISVTRSDERRGAGDGDAAARYSEVAEAADLR